MRAPFRLTLVVTPFPPSETDGPFLPKLSRIPRAIVIRLEKRNPIALFPWVSQILVLLNSPLTVAHTAFLSATSTTEFALFPISFEHPADIPFARTLAVRTFHRAFSITLSTRSHFCFPFVAGLEPSQIADFL